MNLVADPAGVPLFGVAGVGSTGDGRTDIGPSFRGFHVFNRIIRVQSIPTGAGQSGHHASPCQNSHMSWPASFPAFFRCRI
jgi:hypothetical protein